MINMINMIKKNFKNGLKPKASMFEDLDGDELEDFGVFLLFGEISNDNCEDAIRFIIKSNLTKDYDHLTLIINSEGGFISDGYALIDVMEGSRIPVFTVGLGQIASMGLNIFIAGTKGHRTLTPNTLIMSHQWAGGRWGKEHELIAQQKQDEIVTGQIIKHYVKHTGLSEKKVRDLLLPAHDVFLTATEAKKLHLCDNVKDFSEFNKFKNRKVK